MVICSHIFLAVVCCGMMIYYILIDDQASANYYAIFMCVNLIALKMEQKKL